MKILMDEFIKFINVDINLTEEQRQSLARQLQALLASDPDKQVMRQALEFYANPENWAYRLCSPDDICVMGMDDEYAVDVAQSALARIAPYTVVEVLGGEGKSCTEGPRISDAELDHFRQTNRVPASLVSNA